MEKSLINYLNKRIDYSESKYKNKPDSTNPVICISREAGCGGVKIAEILASKLDTMTHPHKWKVISKEIVVKGAKELDMEEHKLKNIIKESDRNLFDDILSAFGDKRFKSKKRIGKTLKEVISSIEEEGYCIIIGRASHIIARNNKKALLLRFRAPMEWRINKIMKKFKLKKEESREFINKVESERMNLRAIIAGNITETEEFDLTLNLSRLDNEKLVDIILYAAQKKGLF